MQKTAAIIFLIITQCITLSLAGQPSSSFDKAVAMIYSLDYAQADRYINNTSTTSCTVTETAFLNQYLHFIKYISCDDDENYNNFKTVHQNSIAQIKKHNTQWDRALHANAMIQLAMVEIGRGNNFNGALALYRGYKVSKNNTSTDKIPVWQLKLNGIFNIIWDNIPDNMRFITSVAGLNGDSQQGLDELQQYIYQTTGDGMQQEAKIIALYCSRIFSTIQTANLYTYSEKDSPIVKFLYTDHLLRTNKGEEAIATFNTITQHERELLPILNYNYSKVLLNSGDLSKSIVTIQKFINQYRGTSFINDSYLQLARAYYLGGNINQAQKWIASCINHSTPRTSIDKQAIKECMQFETWNINLLHARLLFDYGDFSAAKLWAEKPVATTEQTIEQSYRIARIEHKLGNFTDALICYNKTIALARTDSRYFGPYAALFCAEIEIDNNNNTAALQYINTANDLNTGEYQSDIERKIKELRRVVKGNE